MRLLQLFEKYESEKCDQKYKLERILLTSIRIGHLTFIVIFKHENVENELMKRVFLFIIMTWVIIKVIPTFVGWGMGVEHCEICGTVPLNKNSCPQC